MLDSLGSYVEERIRLAAITVRPTYVGWVKVSLCVGACIVATLAGLISWNYIHNGAAEIAVTLPTAIAELFLTNPILIQLFGITEPTISINLVFATVIALVAVFPFAFLIAYPSLMCADRRSGVELEFPFASSIFTLLIEAGVPLMTVFDMMRGKSRSPFPYFSEESERMLWSCKLKGTFAGIRDIVFSHPSREFREFFYGFLSVLESGGDVVTYLHGKSKVTLKVWSAKLRELGSRSHLLMEAYLASVCSLVLVGYVLIMLFTQMADLFPMFSAPALSGYILYIPIFLALIFLFISQAVQVRFPRIRDERYGEALACLSMSSAIAFALFSCLDLAPQDVLCLAVIGGLIYPTYTHERDVRRIRRIEREMPDFISIMAENRRMGFSPEKSAQMTWESLRGGLSSELRRKLTMLELGASLADIFREMGESVRSWFVHGFMLLLSISVEYGGAEVGMLERISDFVHDYYTIKRGHEEEMSMFRYIPYGVLLMTLFAVVAFAIGEAGLSLILSMMSFAVLNGIVSGKVGGSVADGFKHAVVMAAITLAVIDLVLGRVVLITLPKMI